MDNILSIVTFIPALAAAVMALLMRGQDSGTAQRQICCADGHLDHLLCLTVHLFSSLIPPTRAFSSSRNAWIFGLKYKMGVDGISVLFVLLTTFVMPLTILASWSVTTASRNMIAFLLLETLMLGVFVALDMVLFYLFFEAGLIPMFLIIGIWERQDRIYASFKFFSTPSLAPC